MRALVHCITLALISAMTGAADIRTAPEVIVLKQHIPSRAQGGVRYNYLPFQVPAGVTRIDFWCDYDQAGGKNVVDMGLFDAHSTNVSESLEGYRGKGPRSREAAFVAENSASYGYIPGKPAPGTWRIYLDAYKVQPEGVDVAVNVVLTRETAAPTPQSHWLRGDLHTHTLHSDGALTLPALAGVARHNGLDFICITDHNVASHHQEIDALNARGFFPILRGEEVTTDGGHFNACGLPTGSLLDFRISSGDQARLSEVTAKGRQLGALLTANHPFADCQACDWSFDKQMPGFDAVEVWNANWDATDEKALQLWDSILRTGRRITALACSDTHRDTPGSPTTVVAAESSNQEDLLPALRAGQVFLERNPQAGDLTFYATANNGPGAKLFGVGDTITLPTAAELRVHARFSPAPGDGATVSFVTGNGVMPPEKLMPNEEVQKTLRFDQNGYVRVEIRDTKGSMIAMSNPIFVQIGSAH